MNYYTEIHFRWNANELGERQLTAVSVKIVIGRQFVVLAEKFRRVVAAFKQSIIRCNL